MPVWGWAALVVGAYLAYTRFRKGANASVNSSPSSTGAAATDSTGGAGVDSSQAPASGGGGAGDNLSSDLLAAINGLGAGQQAGFDQLASTLNGLQAYDGYGGGFTDTGSTGTVGEPGPQGPPGPPGAAGPVHPAHAKMFGGVISTRTGKGGVKVTTYANGRITEQAPGRSAYVARQGGAHKAAPKQASRKAAPVSRPAAKKKRR